MGTMPQTLPEARAFSAFHTTCLNPESLATVLAKDTKTTKKKTLNKITGFLKRTEKNGSRRITNAHRGIYSIEFLKHMPIVIKSKRRQM